MANFSLIETFTNFECLEDQVTNFEKGFTAEDIRNAFFSLPKNKTGGYDEYSAEFFIVS